MGANESKETQDSPSQSVYIRLGGNALIAPFPQELLRNRGCFRASNGDWFKLLLKGEDNYNVRIIQAKFPFKRNEPPKIQNVLILPVASSGSPLSVRKTKLH